MQARQRPQAPLGSGDTLWGAAFGSAIRAQDNGTGQAS